MRDIILQKVRWSVIRTQETPLLGTLYQKVSRAVTWQIGRKLTKVPGMEAVFLRHSRADLPGFMVGHSDLDLTLVFNDEDAENPERIRTCHKELENLSYQYPIIQIQDTRFVSEGELTQFPRKLSSPFELLYQPEDWFLVAGRDVRRGVSHSIFPDYIPWHSEFNKWWDNIIQHHSFSETGDLEKGFMRTLYRCALKNQITLQAAMGVAVTKPKGFIDDELSAISFNGNEDLKDALIDLKKGNFWVKNPQKIKMRILFLVFLSVRNFFKAWQAHPTIQKETKIRPRSAEEPHCSFYRGLEAKIRNHPEIQAVLRAAVSYPLPHSYPYRYKVDLVLRDALPYADFIKGVVAIEHCFRGRKFSIEESHAEVTLTLESVYKHPLLFLGSPYPFLLEHIQEFGTTVYGQPITTIEGTLSHKDLIEWCRLYFPYHMFNLRRRPEYNSPALNFYQLASIRIFLEYGDKSTDALETRKIYLERFGKSDRDPSILDCFLHGTVDRLDKTMYHDSFVFLSNEYNQLESLLTERNGAKT